jgi:tyrosine-protein kinase Etk/Wzc
VDIKNNTQGNSNGVDIRSILLKFLSKWYFFVAGICLSLVLTKIYLRYQENIYSVSTTLQLKAYTNSYRTLGGLELFTPTDNITDEIQLIKSYDMISKVIKKLDFDVSYFHQGDIRTIEFYKDAPFKVVLDTSSYQLAGVPIEITILGPNKYKIEAFAHIADIVDINTKKIEGKARKIKIQKILKFGEAFKSENLSFKIFLKDPYYKQPEGKLMFLINNPEVLTNFYKNRLVINPLMKESSILKLSVSGPLLEKDIDFLNKATEVYIQDGLDEKNKIATNTINFIDDQLGKISDSLRTAEKEIEKFRSKYNYQETSQGLEKALSKLDDLGNQKADMLMKSEYYQYVLDYIHSNKDIKEIVAPSSIGIEDEILSNLINELIKLKTERTVLSQSTSGRNPYIKDLDRKINTTTETLYENVNNILKVSNIPIKNLSKRMSEIESSLRGMPEQDRLWLDIQRKFNLNNHLYNFLLEKRAEAGITRASTKPDHVVVEKASVLNSTHLSPKISSIYNTAIFLGLIIPLALIFIIDFLNDKIKSKEDLNRRTRIPLFGIIGHKETKSNLVVAEKPKSGIAEAFRSVRTNISYLAPDKQNKVILISSSVSGEGKSFFSVNLANIIAISDKKTILIGADLRKPKIYDDFGLSNTYGLSTYLARKCEIDQAISQTHIPNFDILSSGPIPPNPSELLGSKKMEDLIMKLKGIYDYIIIDTPPIGLVVDGFNLMKFADINIYMVRHKAIECWRK